MEWGDWEKGGEVERHGLVGGERWVMLRGASAGGVVDLATRWRR